MTSEPIIEPTVSEFFDLEADVYYDAIVSVIEAIPNKFPDARSDTQLQWDFEVVGQENDDGTPANKRAWSSPTWNPRAKLYRWAIAILGSVNKDLPFHTSSLIGKPCRIVMMTGVDDKGNATLQLNVAAPLKAAPAKSKNKGTLRERLTDDPPAGATVQEKEPCSVADCGREADGYTSKGTPFCDEHMP